MIFHFVTKICVPSTIFFTFDWVINIVRQSQGGRGVQLPTLAPPITTFAPLVIYGRYIFFVFCLFVFFFFLLVHFYVFLIHLLYVPNPYDLKKKKLKETILYLFNVF